MLGVAFALTTATTISLFVGGHHKLVTYIAWCAVSGLLAVAIILTTTVIDRRLRRHPSAEPAPPENASGLGRFLRQQMHGVLTEAVRGAKENEPPKRDEENEPPEGS